mmetsp:Transcript_29996/g.86314  ORF Transcript_29996/g.86314 Transcript_29996/m.86314 type:complete len:218 (-) Transcript_29996:3671-4324(-)
MPVVLEVLNAQKNVLHHAVRLVATRAKEVACVLALLKLLDEVELFLREGLIRYLADLVLGDLLYFLELGLQGEPIPGLDRRQLLQSEDIKEGFLRERAVDVKTRVGAIRPDKPQLGARPLLFGRHCPQDRRKAVPAEAQVLVRLEEPVLHCEVMLHTGAFGDQQHVIRPRHLPGARLAICFVVLIVVRQGLYQCSVQQVGLLVRRAFYVDDLVGEHE